MKRVCIGFFGFIRNPIDHDVFTRFRKLLPDICIIDIVVSSPNKINEYDDDNNTIDTNSEIVENMRSVFGNCNVYIDLYEYNPLIFIKRVRELGLSDYTDYPTYRIFSQHFSLSRLCKHITQKNKPVYDTILLTRFDIFPSINSLGSLLDQVREDTIHIWRRVPYASDVDAEDRIIISSMNGVHNLCDLYDGALIKDPNIYVRLIPEIILGKYLRTCNLRLLPQEGISFNASPSIHVKYSDTAKKYMEHLLTKYSDVLSPKV
jgi:hypothetical protein